MRFLRRFWFRYVHSRNLQVGKLTVQKFYETANAAQNDCLSRYDIRDRLYEIKIPVFVYCGRYDWITPPKLNEELAEGIEGSKFVVYEKSGHMPALEEKTAFQKEAREFFKRANF